MVRPCTYPTSFLQNEEFSIDIETGIIQTGIEFDREQRERYNITVLALDGGQPPLRLVELENCKVFNIGTFFVVGRRTCSSQYWTSMITLPVSLGNPT